MEDIKDTINRLYDFLTERSKSGDRQVSDAAYAALRRLNAASKRSDIDAVALYNYVLGDQKQYYTRDGIASMGAEIGIRNVETFTTARCMMTVSFLFFPRFILTNVN